MHDIEDEKEAPIGARPGALLALPIDLTLPYGRGSDWSTPYEAAEKVRERHFEPPINADEHG